MRAATSGTGILSTATAYHLSTGGRGWRASLVASCGRALYVQPEIYNGLSAACELVHQASIVHDDVQDHAAMRRFQPSVAARYGAPIAICVGDHLLARAFGVLGNLPGATGLVALFAERITEMAAAQAEELNPMMWEGMTHARYASMADGKVGAMVALAVESVARLGGLTAAALHGASRAARLIGTAYQVGDDIEDLADDLRRGGLNGVIALALDTLDVVERERLRHLLMRASHQGVGLDEAAAFANSLAPTATQLSAWATQLLTEAVIGLDGHRLSQVMTDTADEIAVLLPSLSNVKEYAA
jgi:geranylgeranyl diphosphate synthase type II